MTLPATRPASQHRQQQGAALLVLLMIVGAAAAFVALSAFNQGRTGAERDQASHHALNQARDALLAYAATYRERVNNNGVYGFLPCPDTNDDGIAEPVCGAQNVTVIGRLPWKTLDLPPLRDSSGECLWYVLSGRWKNSPQTTQLNWDSTGQLRVNRMDSTAPAARTLLLGAAAPADNAAALIIAPGPPLGTQQRNATLNGECGGNLNPLNYLEGNDPLLAGTAPAANADSTLTIATQQSRRIVTSNNPLLDTNNDQAAWLVPEQVFGSAASRGRILQRSALLKGDVDGLLNDLATWLNSQAPASLPAATGSKGAAALIAAYTPPAGVKQAFFTHWQDNLLWVKSTLTPGCEGVLLFGGARMAGQNRITAAQRDAASNYLEGANAANFAAGGPFTINPSFNPASAGSDLAICITGTPAAATSVSFASDIARFSPAGAGVTIDTTAKTIRMVNAGGANGGCAWFPDVLTLAGKDVRAWFEFRFTNADPVGGVDLGYGLTLSLVRGTLAGNTPLGRCGTQRDMGALPATDTLACNGSAAGCRHSPANTFEESPSPALHNQRLEVKTGCDASCTSCTPAGHGGATTYARIRVWTDCVACSGLSSDLAAPPNLQRCENLSGPLAGALNQFYFGLTAGMHSAGGGQGVLLQNFSLTSQ